ncbi:hypothetical protein AOLI_G00312640 [Acnodon oligacanthus]
MLAGNSQQRCPQNTRTHLAARCSCPRVSGTPPWPPPVPRAAGPPVLGAPPHRSPPPPAP